MAPTDHRGPMEHGGSVPRAKPPRGRLTDPMLSVVMPVYNERRPIDEIVRRVLAVPLRVELIVALWVLVKYRFTE